MNEKFTVLWVILTGLGLIVMMGYSAFMFFVLRTWYFGLGFFIFIGLFYFLGKYISKLQEEGFY